MVHLFHHVDFNITATVHLAHVAGKDVSNTHVSIICNIKLDPAIAQKFFFGGTLGQYSWPSRLNKASASNLNISILLLICADRASGFWIFRSHQRHVQQAGQQWELVCFELAQTADHELTSSVQLFQEPAQSRLSLQQACSF